MAEGLGTVLALAQLAYETCQNASALKEDCVRLGERLMNLMVLTREWTSTATTDAKKNAPTRSALVALEGCLTRLNLSLQALTTPRAIWSAKVKKFLETNDALDALKKAESDLDQRLNDFQVHQNVRLLQEQRVLLGRLGEVSEVLKRLAQERTGSSALTKAEQIDAVLEDCQAKPLPDESIDTGSMATSSSPSSSDEDSVGFFDEAAEKELAELQVISGDLQCPLDKKDLLGTGGFSQVFKGRYRGHQVAVKLLKMDTAGSEQEHRRRLHRMRTEAALTARCGIHPNVVQILGFEAEFSNREIRQRPLLILELMETTLRKALSEGLLGTSLVTRARLLRGIADALEFLHLQGIVHGDIKSLNILLGDGRTVAKLSDFGEAREKGLGDTTMYSVIDGSECNQAADTMAYRAPEQFKSGPRVSRKAEMYRFGVVVWECLTGEIPHQGKGRDDLWCLVKDDTRETLLELPSDVGHRVPKPTQERQVWDNMRALAKACMARNPKQRPTATLAEQILSTRVRLASIPGAAATTATVVAGAGNIAGPPTGHLTAHEPSTTPMDDDLNDAVALAGAAHDSRKRFNRKTLLWCALPVVVVILGAVLGVTLSGDEGKDDAAFTATPQPNVFLGPAPFNPTPRPSIAPPSTVAEDGTSFLKGDLAWCSLSLSLSRICPRSHRTRFPAHGFSDSR